MIAPFLLLCVYFYFHFYLQKLWEELSSFPAVFSDGRSLYTKADPWLLNDLVRAHLPMLKTNRPFLSYFQLWISVLLACGWCRLLCFCSGDATSGDTSGLGRHFMWYCSYLVSGRRLPLPARGGHVHGVERKPFAWEGIVTSRRGYQTAAFAVLLEFCSA